MINFGFFEEVAQSLWSNRTRTLLTGFGVFWGLMLLVLLLGVGDGLKKGSARYYGADDPNSIWFSARTTAQAYGGFQEGRRIVFDYSDIEFLENTISGIEFVGAENRAGKRWSRNVPIVHQSRSASFPVLGVTADFFQVKRYLDIQVGRGISPIDIEQRRKIAFLGSKTLQPLFGQRFDPVSQSGSPVGKLISVHGINLRVVGAFHDDGWNGRMAERIYIPMSVYEQVFGENNQVDVLAVKPKEGVDPFLLADEIEAALKSRHSISPSDTKAISVGEIAESGRERAQMQLALTVMIWAVGLGTLMAGIVGIGNIMIITVSERTRELGIRKALGATPISLLSLIISEALLLTLSAGYLGLLAGMGLVKIFNHIIVLQGGELAGIVDPSVNLTIALLALSVLVIAGIVAGIVPALRAAYLDPVSAMAEDAG